MFRNLAGGALALIAPGASAAPFLAEPFIGILEF